MSQFDAYHKWLGIPPDEQPPDHYRLLGIRRFEDDPDVIAAAADQRMVHLRTYQLGAYSELSQRLLNEVATAKVCLLNPEKKAAYDERLRQELAPVEVGEPAAPEPILPVLPAPSIHGTTPRRRKQQPWLIPIAVAAALVCLGIVAVAVSSHGGKEVAEPAVNGAQQHEPVVPPPTASKPPTPPKVAKVANAPKTPSSTIESRPTGVNPSPQPEPPKTQKVGIEPKAKASSGETVLLKDGRPLVRVRSDKHWVERQGFLEGQDPATDLVFWTELGKEDFVLELTMSLEVLNGTGARMALHGKTWGVLNFDSDGDQQLVSASRLFGKEVRHGSNSRYIKEGVPFKLAVVRSGSKITWKINDQKVASRLLLEESLNTFVVGPGRSRMRLYEVTLKHIGESDATSGTQR